MKNVSINLEMNINRNLDYKLLQDIYKKSYSDIKMDVSLAISAGKYLERTYNIRHDSECTQKEYEVTKSITDIQFAQYEKMYNELLELKKENLAMRKALKDNEIIVTIEHVKYYGNNEKLAI